MIGFLPRGSYNSISINPSVFPCLIKSLIYKGMERGGKEGRKEIKRGGGEIKRDKEKRGEEWGGIKRERGRRNKEGHSGEEREREGVEKHQLHSRYTQPTAVQTSLARPRRVGRPPRPRHIAHTILDFPVPG